MTEQYSFAEAVRQVRWAPDPATEVEQTAVVTLFFKRLVEGFIVSWSAIASQKGDSYALRPLPVGRATADSPHDDYQL